jgi:hypothetical protein
MTKNEKKWRIKMFVMGKQNFFADFEATKTAILLFINSISSLFYIYFFAYGRGGVGESKNTSILFC